MGLLIFFAVYLTLAVLTARHRIYRTKIANDGVKFYGHTLGPRLYSQREYRKMYETGTSVSTDLEYGGLNSDYRDIAACAMFFPVYWSLVVTRFTGHLLWMLLTAGVKKTPGEARVEEEERERQRQRRAAEVDRLQREIDRMKKEQGW